MKLSRLKSVTLAAAFLALSMVVVLQQLRIKRLMADAALFRQQSTENSGTQAENQRLAEQLQTASARAETERKELLRLRGQSVLLRQQEQENARLIAERDRLAKATPPAVAEAEEPDEPKTPEAKLQRAKGFFGRDLGLALITIAEANDGNLPTELRGPAFEVLEQFSSSNRDYNFRVKDFEMVYKGSLREVKNVSETIVAREKEPVQLANGQWTRLYVLADGSSQHVNAPSLDGFAAREQEFWPGQGKR